MARKQSSSFISLSRIPGFRGRYWFVMPIAQVLLVLHLVIRECHLRADNVIANKTSLIFLRLSAHKLCTTLRSSLVVDLGLPALRLRAALGMTRHVAVLAPSFPLLDLRVLWSSTKK